MLTQTRDIERIRFTPSWDGCLWSCRTIAGVRAAAKMPSKYDSGASWHIGGGPAVSARHTHRSRRVRRRPRGIIDSVEPRARPRITRAGRGRWATMKVAVIGAGGTGGFFGGLLARAGH